MDSFSTPPQSTVQHIKRMALSVLMMQTVSPRYVQRMGSAVRHLQPHVLLANWELGYVPIADLSVTLSLLRLDNVLLLLQVVNHVNIIMNVDQEFVLERNVANLLQLKLTIFPISIQVKDVKVVIFKAFAVNVLGTILF
jgi:hypothetical protein